jgi:8-oxo-dGTP diphosphatase
METGLEYTLCFIRRGEEILMLNRENTSWMGSWNGVGGRLEHDEEPKEGILREVYEETGIRLSDARDCGIVTWEADGENFGGMHVFIADVPEDYDYPTPKGTPEGILDWKKTEWIFNPQNTGVIKNIQHFLPVILKSEKRYAFACIYEGYELVEFLDEEME